MGDWLGTFSVSNRCRVFRPYNQAKQFVHSLKLKNTVEWNAYLRGELPHKKKKPQDIPTTPAETYANKGWLGFGDWLGTNRVSNWKRTYLPFQEARRYAWGLGLQSKTEWEIFCRGLLPKVGTLPSHIPTNPNRTYSKTGWVSYGDWLGTGNVPGGVRGPQKKKYA